MTEKDGLQILDWQYLAEGNSSIVYSCVSESKIVLRVKKHYQKRSLYTERKETQSTLQNNNIYKDSILKQLFDNEEYFISTQVITLSQKDRERLKSITLSAESRPDKRRQQSFELGCSAMVMPHLGFYQFVDSATFSPRSYAVEIKPKWGFLPKSTNKSMGMGDTMELSACRFCIHQYLKMKTGVISSVTPYCPLDLFASCSCRVKRALKSLFQEPQNNLRLFYNGILIYSGLKVEGSKDCFSSLNKCLNNISTTSTGIPLTFDDLVELVSAILVHDSWKGMENQSNPQHCAASSTPICKTKEKIPLEKCGCSPLGQIGILKRLLRLQQISSLDATTVKSFIKIMKERDEPTIDLNRIQDYTSKHWECFAQSIKDGCLKDNGSTEELLHEIQKFLVSATFKDCSIMLTFTEYCEGDEYSQKDNIIEHCTSNAKYAYSIKLIDLDPKPIEKMDYYEQLDHDILKTYREYFKN